MKKRNFFSLQYKYLISSFILVLISIFIMGIFLYKESMDIVKQKVNAANLNTIVQAGERIEMVFNDVHSLSLDLYKNDDIRSIFLLKNISPYNGLNEYILKLNNELSYLCSSKSYIYSVYVKGFNGLSIDTKNAFNNIDTAEEQEMISLNGGYVWNNDTLIGYDNTPIKVFSLTRVMKDINDTSKELALVKINISEQYLSQIYANQISEKQSNMFIIDNSNAIVSAENKKMLGEKLDPNVAFDTMKDLHEGLYETSYKGEKCFVYFYALNGLEYKLINIVPLNELLKENEVIKNYIVKAIGVSLLFGILITFIFSAKILSPLKEIRLKMKMLENEDFNVKININGNDEIAMLGNSFNKMSAKLNQLINQIYICKIRQREAELSAIRAQINPHFLYNSFDTIYWMARMEKAPETSKLIEVMANYFRFNLDNGEEFITLEEEIEHLCDYIFIQKKRYNDSIHFDIKMDKSLFTCKVIKLALQPLTENAIIHGINGKDGKGNISIIIKKSNTDIVYEIEDDGIGVNVEEMETLLKKTDNNRGFGIKNINDRLNLYYGEKYGIHFFSEIGKWTKVVVNQPIQRSKTDEGGKNDQPYDC